MNYPNYPVGTVFKSYLGTNTNGTVVDIVLGCYEIEWQDKIGKRMYTPKEVQMIIDVAKYTPVSPTLEIFDEELFTL